MPDSNGVQLICFDLGRVLVRICDNWKQAFELINHTSHVNELDISSKRALHALVVEIETGRMAPDEFCLQASRLFGVDPAAAKSMFDAYTLDVFPGAYELLDALRAANRKTACLSNTNPNHWHVICNEGGRSYIPMEKFDYPFASHLIGHRKPDEEIYRHVEQVTGLNGSGILFFDDLKENIEAARLRGWIAEQIVPGSDPIGQIRKHLSKHKVPV